MTRAVDPDRPVRLGGRARPCAGCGAEIVFALTVATDRRRGGKWMMLDAISNPDGNVAVRDNGRVLLARPLAKDETHERGSEVRAMPHQATCAIRKVGDEAEAFLRELFAGGES